MTALAATVELVILWYFFSPKGWEFSAQGKSRSDAALGRQRAIAHSPKG